MKREGCVKSRKSAAGDAGDGAWLLQQAESITAFVAKQRSRTHQSGAKTAAALTWEQLAAEGEAAHKQLHQALQHAAATGGCPDTAREAASLQLLHKVLECEAQEERLQLLAQVQQLGSLVRCAACRSGAADADDAGDTAALASLRQELAWLREDVVQQAHDLAAAAQDLIEQLPAAATSSSSNSSCCMLSDCLRGTGSSSSSSQRQRSDHSDSLPGCSDVVQQHEGSSSGACDSAQLPCGGGSSSSSLLASLPAENSHDGLAQLQELLRCHTLAPDAVKHQLLHEHAALWQQHQQQVQQLRKQQRRQQAQLLADDRQGEWSADEHVLFLWLRGRALKAAAGTPAAGAARRQGAAATVLSSSSGITAVLAAGRPAAATSRAAAASTRGTASSCSRAAVLDQVALSMPGKTRQQLEAHEAWHVAASQLQRRLEAAVEDWQRQRGSLLVVAQQRLQDATAATAAAAEAAAARLSTAVGRTLLGEQLQGLALVRQQQQEHLALQHATQAAADAASAAVQEAARQARAAGQRMEVAAYKQQLREQELAAGALTQQLEAGAAAAASEAVAAQRPAVEARQAGARRRLGQQQERQQQQRAAAEARQRRLDAIAAALGPQLPRDPQRLLQPTAASAAAAPPQDPAFRPVHGFTTQQVVADPRFRLVEALAAAGRLRGPAGAGGSGGYLREAMARLAPPRAGGGGSSSSSRGGAQGQWP